MNNMATSDCSDDILSNKDGDLNCEPCFSDGRTRTVEGFCMECNEYLCQSCLDAHRILRVTKTHHVKRGEHIPKRKTSNEVQQGCHLHTDSKITYFCKSHQQVCCDHCVILAHKGCNDVKSIDDYSEEFVDCHYKTVTVSEKIKLLQCVYTAKTEEAKRNLNDVDLYYHNAMDTFKTEVDKIKITDIKKLKAIVSTYENVLSHMAVYNQAVETFTQTKESKDIFVEMLKTEAEVRLIEANILKLTTDDSIVKYGFISDDASLLRLAKAPFLVKTITIRHGNDKETCRTADIALLRKNLILIADYANSKLKLFNTDSASLISSMELKSCPWQLSVAEHDEVYVALNDQPKILHLKLPATDLDTFREVTVDGKCSAVECFNKTMKVQCVSPAKTIEVDGDGIQVRLINTDLSKETANGEQFVTNPRWSTKDSDTGSMFVSCDTKNSVTEITGDGKVKLLVKSDKLNSPAGLCMDTNGSILVCSYWNKDVYRVKRNGDIQSVLPQPLDFATCAVALDKSTKRLYVGGNSDKIHVFQV